MIFKKIEMVGFKSFADRTVIEFDNNFTAIVGPNGCGKSNVSDAIRWVLGEQSPKSLRGNSMQDVIFNGTEKRKSLSYCEVTLTFDNSTRFFNFDYDELAITRKLYRSGESEYLINRNTCHLRDITNLLYNSGLGKNGYSVVGQGKVTEIVDSKPENRRAMFEDAAGISKYKSDKAEAERKLDRTRDNLTRIRDILSEIERQMGPLKKQAENAKKYLEFKGQLKDLEVNAYIYQYENANTLKAQIGVKLQAIEEQLSLRQEEFENANKAYDKSMLDLENFDKLLSSLNNQILELTVNLEKQEGETKIARERINFTHKENDRLHLDRTNSIQALELAKEQKTRKEEELNDLNSDFSALESSFTMLSDQYSKIANDLILSEDEQGASQQKIIETLGSLSDIKSSVSRLMAEKELLSNNLISIQEDMEGLNAKKTEVSSSLLEVRRLLEEKENLLSNLKKQEQELLGKQYIEENKIKDLENEKANLTTQIKVYENRKKLLTDLQTEYEGYAYSVKKLLKESERNSELRKNIVGVVASLIKVPQKFETAIEVALGGAVQNIVTFDEDGAKMLIKFLKENQYGRATFLPITSMKSRTINKSLIQGKNGCFGVASDLVDYDKKIENVVSNLLGGTVIVENLSIAVNLAKSTSYTFRIVTLDGDVVNPQGSLTGGSKKAEAVNIMGRQREIESLGDEIIKLTLKQEQLGKSYDESLISFQNGKKEIVELQNKKTQLDGTVAPGKKIKGVIGYEVPVEWKEIEIHFTENVWSSNKMEFVIRKE